MRRNFICPGVEAKRSSLAEGGGAKVVSKLTDDLGGTWTGNEGVVPCSVFLPDLEPDPWNLTISNFFDTAVWFTLEREGPGPGPRIYYGPWFDISGTSDPSDAFKLPSTEELKTMLRDWIARVRKAERFCEEERRRSEQALSIWNEAKPIKGTPAEAYLRRMGIPPWLPLPDTLRYYPNCWHPSGPTRPAMVAYLSDDLHRVYPEREMEPGEVPPFPMVHMTYLPQDGSAEVAEQPEEFLLGRPGSAVEIVKQPLEGSAPILVAESTPSALALASGAAPLLPHPVRILATLSPEGTAMLRLPADREPPMPGYGTVWRVQDPRWVIIARDGGAESRTAADELAGRAWIFFRIDLLNAPDGLTWVDAGRQYGFGQRRCLSWTLDGSDYPAFGRENAADPVPADGLDFAGRAELEQDLDEDLLF